MILNLDCNLDKDLSKSRRNNQLVKYKDILSKKYIWKKKLSMGKL